MEEEKNRIITDKLNRAIARITGLRQNVPNGKVKESFVVEYHEALSHLKELGLDIEEFRIPEKEIQPRPLATQSISGPIEYGNQKYVDNNFFGAKLDAALGYLGRLLDKPQERMGFKPTSEG